MRKIPPVSRLFLALVPIMLAVAVYAPIGGFAFVTFDDPGYVTANELVLRGLTRDGFIRAFTEFRFANWHPLTWISHMVDVSLFGAAPLSAGAHHIVNVAFHAANAALLFLFLYASTGAAVSSVLVAVFFALHPMHVESVAWISERKDVLSGLFAMLTLLAYVWYARNRKAGRYILVVLAFVAGLLSKATLVTIPFVLLLLDIWPLGGVMAPLLVAETGNPPSTVTAFSRVRWRWAIIEKLPLLALSIILSVVTIAAQRAGGAVSELGDIPVSLRLSNAVLSYVAYIGKAVWPTHLAALYVLPLSIPAWKVAGSAMILIALTVAIIMVGRSRPFLTVGWFWFLGMMVPMVGIVQVGRQAMADRYAYLPFIGLYIAFSFLFCDLFLKCRRRSVRIAMGILIAGVVIMLGLAARAQLAHWKNSRALFERLIESDPGDGWYNLGNLDLLDGNRGGAEKSFLMAIRTNPRHARARTALAVERIKDGHIAEAIPLLEESIRLEPDYVKSWYNLGAAYGRLGNEAASLRIYEQVLAWRPDDTNAMLAAGSLRIRKGDIDSGLSILERAATLAPEDRELLIALRDEAIHAGREAVARKAEDQLQRMGPR